MGKMAAQPFAKADHSITSHLTAQIMSFFFDGEQVDAALCRVFHKITLCLSCSNHAALDRVDPPVASNLGDLCVPDDRRFRRPVMHQRQSRRIAAFSEIRRAASDDVT